MLLFWVVARADM
ncbi:UNVERIFIED_CONTAM: hypothetical protein GTU68_056291 [Idotea baltica]|nr:hypothetical protein [Idotea baltica]